MNHANSIYNQLTPLAEAVLIKTPCQYSTITLDGKFSLAITIAIGIDKRYQGHPSVTAQVKQQKCNQEN